MVSISALSLAILMVQNLESPRLTLAEGLILHLPSNMLAIPEIRSQVDSGLTLTFVYRYRLVPAPPSGEERGETAITIRFEPWEEIYHIGQVGESGTRQWHLAGAEALGAWWRDHTLVLFPVVSERPGEVHLVMEVAPFSEGERREAFNRFSKPGPAPFETKEGSPPSGDRPGGGPPGNEIINLIIRSSANRPTMFRFSWKLKF